MRVDSAIFDPWLQISNFLLPRFSTVVSVLHFCPPQRIRYPNIVLLYLYKYLNHAQDPQRKLWFQIMYVFSLSCPSATFALQRGGFAPREWLAAKGLL